jgi:hypothetical protein
MPAFLDYLNRLKGLGRNKKKDPFPRGNKRRQASRYYQSKGIERPGFRVVVIYIQGGRSVRFPGMAAAGEMIEMRVDRARSVPGPSVPRMDMLEGR